MAEIRYQVTVDSAGAVTAIQRLDDAFKKGEAGVKGMGGAAGSAGSAMGGLWKQFAIGQLAIQGIKKTYDLLTGAITGSIQAAMDQEKQDNALRSALTATGRTVEGNLEHYKSFASELQNTTVYADDAVQGAQALLLSLTRLDQEGIDKATKGAAGLATVFGMDLQSAATLVGKAMEGNFGALSRYGIRVDETLSLDEKRAQLLEKLNGFYSQSEKEINTFGGSLAQLKNQWGDVQEEVGNAIIKNEAVRDTIADLSGKIKALVASDDFKLWVSAAAEMVTKLARAVGWVTENVGKLMEKLSGAKGYREFIAEQERAHGVMQEGVNIIQLRRRAIDEEILTVKEWGAAFKKYGGDNQAMMRAIAEGKEGPETLRLYEELKTSTEAAARAAEEAAARTRPAINETGDAAALAAAELQKLKSELKLTFTEDLRAQIEKIEDALVLFRDKLSPAAAEELRKKLAELKAEMGAAAKEIDFDIGSASDATATLTERLYGAGIAALLAAKESDPLAEEFQKIREKAEAAGEAIDFTTKLSIRKEIREKQRLLREFGDSMPTSEVQRLRAEIAALKAELAEPAWVGQFKAALDQASTYLDAAFSGMNAIISQSQKNREIEIENEYKKRLDAINANISDETERQNAVNALEAEYNIKRTSAKRAAAKQQKAIALMEAVVNTARAVTEALPNFILAALVGAMGAVQIALIARQPIPLAKGAVFDKPTRFATEGGGLYVAGEAGTELLVPDKKLREIMRQELKRTGAGRQSPRTLQININGRKIAEALLPELADLGVKGRMTYDIAGLVRSES